MKSFNEYIKEETVSMTADEVRAKVKSGEWDTKQEIVPGAQIQVKRTGEKSVVIRIKK